MNAYQQMLQHLGRRAGRLKNPSPAYSKVIEGIDHTAAAWREAEPERFWDPESEEYKKLATRWRLDREMRNQHRALGI